jgi:hypothetical protein
MNNHCIVPGGSVGVDPVISRLPSLSQNTADLELLRGAVITPF